jgi:LCP family protein required for cell wall assembly
VSDRTPPRDSRKIHVPAPGSGGPDRPPPRPGTPPSSANGRARPEAPAPRPTAPARPRPVTPAPAKATPSPRPAPAAGGKGRRLPRRPKLRRILLLTSLFLPLLLLLGALLGWLYARSVYDKVEKIPLADVLSAEGTGTNYLIVGSDSRNPEDIAAAGLNPAAFEDGGGERSDTMLLLRFVGGQAKMLSIPRDLYVPIAETDGSAKINSAYGGGGPRRLVLTVQQALGVPVHHYMEVDFVSFAKLVDSLGGVTIDFPNPAHDPNTGLDVTQAGPNELDGPQALAFVRSRHYVEVIDGRDRPDPTADLGRVQRQQQFLKAVFGKLGDSKNPITLARAASSASGGLRVDDTLGLTDAIRLAWRLRSLDPESVPLPTKLGSNRSGSVLFLIDPDSQTALDQFR